MSLRIQMWKPKSGVTRFVSAAAAAFVLALAAAPARSQSQEWVQYPAFDDFFSVNFPGEPTIRKQSYRTEFGATLPSRVYSAKDDFGTYSVTVVDWSTAKQQHEAIYKACMAETGDMRGGENPGVCSDRTRYEIAGAKLHAAFAFLKRDSKVEYFAYNPADNVQGIGMELINADGSQTTAEILMHEERLYILEATAPADAPPPSAFTISIQFLDKEGRRIRYDGPYAPLFPVPPRTR